MDNNTVFIVTGVLAVVAVLLFMRSSSSRSLTEQKRIEVQRKRAALIAKRKAEAAAAEANAATENSAKE